LTRRLASSTLLKQMRTAILLLSLTLLGACDSGITGACNICPTFKLLGPDACAEAGKKAGCAKAELRTVTDDTCAQGKPVQTHQECAYTDCDDHLACDTVVDTTP
jgi:hypothetical protein